MYLTTYQLQEIIDHAANLMSIKEIANIIEVDEIELFDEINDRSSYISQAYYKSTLKMQSEQNQYIIAMAADDVNAQKIVQDKLRLKIIRDIFNI